MSKAGKLVKDLVKAKKESVMGKLANGDDPMEPWSKRFDAPIKEEDLNEDTWLYRYVRSLGWDPQHMTFAQQSKYSRSNAFKTWKKSHMERGSAMEEVVTKGSGTKEKQKTPYRDINSLEYRAAADKQKQQMAKDKLAEPGKKLADKIAKKGVAEGSKWRSHPDAYDVDDEGNKTPRNPNTPKFGYDPLQRRADTANDAKTPRGKTAALKTSLKMAKGNKGVAEEQLDEAGTGLLMSYIKSKGLDPRMMDGNQKSAYSKSSEFRIFKNRHVKEVSGMGERGDDWNEEKKAVKEAVDAKDTVTMDIPLLIRVLEYAREDAKTDMDLHKVVENLINMRAEGSLSMDMYDKIVAIKEEIEKLDELSKGTLTSYATKARADAANLSKQGDAASKRSSTKSMQTALDKFRKAAKRNIGAAGAESKARVKEEVEQIDELKKQNDNMEIDDRITREDLRKWFSKTDPEGDWKRINSKGEVAGPCAREPGEPKPKCMSKEKRSQLSKSERASAVAAKRKHDPVADRAGKGGKPVNVSNYGKGKLSEEEIDEACWDTHKQVGTKMKGGKVVPNCVPKNEEVEQIDEKNKPTNPGLWSRAKAMARSKFDVYPSAYANGWASKWYKSKGGGWKSVKEDTVQEGIYGIEDSPMSATNSVKAMESTGRKKQMTKSARMIKSIYKKKNVKETMYDWEKSEKGGKVVDEPTAKVIMKGGTTMTGQPRDTIEIEPVLRTKLNRPAGMNPSAQ